MGADAVGAALRVGVAGRAFLEHVRTVRGVGGGESCRDRRHGVTAIAALGLDTLDRVAHLFRALRVKHHAAQNREPERRPARSEETTSELQSLMRISYHAYCLQTTNSHTKTNQTNTHTHTHTHIT